MNQTIKNCLILIPILCIFIQNVFAQTPCDFKGISVGDRMSPNQIMSALGITNYKTNPKRPSYEDMHPMIEKYGFAGAFELIDEKIGNSCEDSSCIVSTLAIGNNIPASVFFSFNPNTKIIDAIEIKSNEVYWGELKSILINKYGTDWSVEREKMSILNRQTNKSRNVDREIMNHKTGGKNSKTNDNCEITATNFDIIFTHPGSNGLYQSAVDIKLISKNF